MPFITTALWILGFILPFSFQLPLPLSDILTTLNYLYSLNILFTWRCLEKPPCLCLCVYPPGFRSIAWSFAGLSLSRINLSLLCLPLVLYLVCLRLARPNRFFKGRPYHIYIQHNASWINSTSILLDISWI